MISMFDVKVYLKYVMLFICMFCFHQNICFAIGGPGIFTDDTLPVITLLGDVEVSHEAGNIYDDAGATATDNIDGDITDSIIINNSVDVNVPGAYVIRYNVQDNAGNEAVEVTRTVNVIDTTIPVITIVGDASISHPAGTEYNDAGAAAVDNIDGDITTSIIINSSVDVNVPGVYTVRYNVQDSAGNSAIEVTRSVMVVDIVSPVITLLGNSEITLTVGDVFADPGATALDDIDGDVTGNIDVTGAVDSITIGIYELYYNVSDTSGNNALEVVRTVNVIDQEKHAPVAFDGSLLLDEDTVTSGILIADDKDGDTLTYSLVSSGSKGFITITDSSTGAYTYSPYADENGMDTFTFRVNDGLYNSDTATITVTINSINDAPVAVAGPDQTVNEAVEVINLNGSGSTDVDDGIDVYLWEQISGPTVILTDTNTELTSFETPDVDTTGASLTFRLTVTDTLGLLHQDTCIVNVTWVNMPPTADAGADQTVNEGDSVSLDASASIDLDDGIYSYKWTQVQGPQVSLDDDTAVQPVFNTPDVDGDTSMTFELTVTDEGGLQATDTCIVNVTWVNMAPSADAGADQTVDEQLQVNLNGSGSFDLDDGISGYQWRQTSGTPVTLSNAASSNPFFTAPDVGPEGETLIFELTVTDNNGLKTTDSCSINVTWINESPVADAGIDQNVDAGDIVTLDGSRSSDTDDGIDSYTWVQTEGVSVDLLNSNTEYPVFPAPDIETDTATLSFVLTVQDAHGLESTDTVSVHVVGNNSNIEDSDGDGYVDEEDAFPFDDSEWLDTDSDGTGDNADLDDDNDGMSDEWENTYGLNPLVDDATEDFDNDGMSNLDEYAAGTDPTEPPDDPVSNHPPATPEPYLPVDGAIDIPLQPELETNGFFDADEGDEHAKTRWQISTDTEFSSLVLDRETSKCLVSVTVPQKILEPNTQYFWRVKFYDNHLAASEWSETYSFETQDDEVIDGNANGIPDDQDVDSTTDLDQNGSPDIHQRDIKSLKNKDTQTQIGITEVTNGAVVESAEMVSINELNIDSKSGNIPFGLIGFTIHTQNPGDETSITVFFSKRLHPDSVWYKYDEISGLVDYSDHAFISEDRLSIVIELKDGGYGDADGTENGRIVDPGGVFGSIDETSDSDTEDSEDKVSIVESLVEETANCFISNVDDGNTDTYHLLFILAILAVGIVGRIVIVKWRGDV